MARRLPRKKKTRTPPLPRVSQRLVVAKLLQQTNQYLDLVETAIENKTDTKSAEYHLMYAGVLLNSIKNRARKKLF